MKITGYDDMKSTFQVEMEIKKIVDLGLDPWRLDLFDPDPVPVLIGSKRLYFRKLRGDIAFSYWLEEDTNITCIWDEEKQVSIVHSADTDTIDSATTGSQLFTKHFRKYLDTYVKVLDFDEDHREEFLSAPTTAVGSTFDGVEVSLGNQSLDYSYPVRPHYVGEMFAPVQRKIELPGAIARIFEDLDGYNPLVCDRWLSLALLGKTPKPVCVLVDHAGLARAQAQFGARSETWIARYKLDSVEYELKSIDIVDPSERQWLTSSSGGLSIDGVYSTNPTEVWGTRIAFYDLDNNQARVFSFQRLMNNFRPPQIEIVEVRPMSD